MNYSILLEGDTIGVFSHERIAVASFEALTEKIACTQKARTLTLSDPDGVVLKEHKFLALSKSLRLKKDTSSPRLVEWLEFLSDETPEPVSRWKSLQL